MNLRRFKPRDGLFWENVGVCLALFLSVAKSNAQNTVLWSYGQGGQDAGIDVIQPGYPVTLEWSQSISFANVSISTGLASFNSSGTGWATLSLGNDLIASTDFDYPNNYGSVALFAGLSLPSGTYDLTIGAYTGQDVGWGVPAGDTLYSADNVTYIGTFTRFGVSNPVDFSIVSVPEPSIGVVFGLGLVAFVVRRLRTKVIH